MAYYFVRHLLCITVAFEWMGLWICCDVHVHAQYMTIFSTVFGTTMSKLVRIQSTFWKSSSDKHRIADDLGTNVYASLSRPQYRCWRTLELTSAPMFAYLRVRLGTSVFIQVSHESLVIALDLSQPVNSVTVCMQITKYPIKCTRLLHF